MASSPFTLDAITTCALQVSAIEKLPLIERLAAGLEHEVAHVKPAGHRSLYGLWTDLGPAPSAEEIGEARQEM